MRRRVTEVVQELNRHSGKQLVKRYTGRNPYVESMPCIHKFVIEQHKQRPLFTLRPHMYIVFFFPEKTKKSTSSSMRMHTDTAQLPHKNGNQKTKQNKE